MKNLAIILALFVSVIVEALALLLAVASAGAGHGNYLFAHIFFPFEMALGVVSGTLAGLPIVLALIHYPAFVMSGFAFKTPRTVWIYTGVVVAAHVLTTAALMIFGTGPFG
jgi:hypothetical protein